MIRSSDDKVTSVRQVRQCWAGRSGLTLEALRVVHHEWTDFQELEVVEADGFGRCLLLDGALQLAERDEAAYHEALVQVPACALTGAPRRVLIVGGGDGCALREVLRWPVERVVVAELDPRVVAVAREHLGGLNAGAFDDERVLVVEGDAAESVRRESNWARGGFDLVVMDMTDVAEDSPLVGDDFVAVLAAKMVTGGVVVAQAGSPHDGVPGYRNTVRALARALRDQLGVVLPYVASVPSFDFGTHAFLVAGDPSPRLPVREPPDGLRWWTPEVHEAAFAIPRTLRWLEEVCRG